MLQQAPTANVPGIRQDEASGLMQSAEYRTALGN